jgi:hypothetical protein
LNVADFNPPFAPPAMTTGMVLAFSISRFTGMGLIGREKLSGSASLPAPPSRSR